MSYLQSPGSNVATLITAVLGMNSAVHAAMSYFMVFHPATVIRRLGLYGDHPAIAMLDQGAREHNLSLATATMLDLTRKIGSLSTGLCFLSAWSLYKFYKTDRLSEGSAWTLAITSLSKFVLGVFAYQGGAWKQDFMTLTVLDGLMGIVNTALALWIRKEKVNPAYPVKRLRTSDTTHTSTGGHTANVQ